MDSRQTRKAVQKIEIVREGASMRKIRLSDIMSEGFSTYLMKLDGDFIAPTGARISRIEEVAKADISALAHKKSEERKARGEKPDPTADWLESEKELRDQEDTAEVDAAAAAAKEREAELYPDNSQGAPSVAGTAAQTPAAPVGAVEPVEKEVPPPAAVDPDTSKLGSDSEDSGTVENGSDDSETNNDEAPPALKPGDSEAAVDTQDTTSAPDELGGPDEFDEKNRAFTSYIDNLIKGRTGSDAGDNLPDVSERASRGARSLIEAVYGSQKIEIVDYKRSR